METENVAMTALVMCEDRWYHLCRYLLEAAAGGATVGVLVDIIGEALDGIDAWADESDRMTALVDVFSAAVAKTRDVGVRSGER